MLHERSTARTLGLARICVFGLAALSRLFTPLWEACLLPDYQPPTLLRLLGAEGWAPLISFELAVGIQALTMGLLLVVAVGIGPYRLLAPMACVALTLTEGLLRGTGIPTHANLILLLSAYVLVFFPAADALTLMHRSGLPRTPPAQYQAALVTLSLVFCATYLFVGARRLSASGIEIFFDDSILTATAVRDAELGQSGGLGLMMCESVWGGWALRVGFPLITLLELLTPLCLFSRWFRWIWLTAMVPFHFGTGWLMGIWFPYHLALIPILIADLDPFRQAPEERKVERTGKSMKRAA